VNHVLELFGNVKTIKKKCEKFWTYPRLFVSQLYFEHKYDTSYQHGGGNWPVIGERETSWNTECELKRLLSLAVRASPPHTVQYFVLKYNSVLWSLY